MAVIKCKMCGGDLNLVPGESVVECELQSAIINGDLEITRALCREASAI